MCCLLSKITRLPLQPSWVEQNHMTAFTTWIWLDNLDVLSKVTCLPLQPKCVEQQSHDCLYNPDVLSSHKTLPLQPSCVEQSHMTAITLYSTLPNLQPSCFEQNHVVPPSGYVDQKQTTSSYTSKVSLHRERKSVIIHSHN